MTNPTCVLATEGIKLIGFVEIEIPERCGLCQLSYWTACTAVSPHKAINFMIDHRPEWCPIKEHDLGVCSEKHKEMMENLHIEVTKKLGW